MSHSSDSITGKIITTNRYFLLENKKIEIQMIWLTIQPYQNLGVKCCLLFKK